MENSLVIAVIAPIAMIFGLIIGFFCRRKKQQSIDQKFYQEKENLKNEISLLGARRNKIQVDIEALISQREKQKQEDNKILDEYYKEKKQLIDEKISTEFEISREKLKQNIAKIAQEENNQLETKLQKNQAEFEAKMAKMEKEKELANKELEMLMEKRRAAIEAAKREENLRKQTEFYCLQITEQDISDIKELKLIEKRLNKKEVLNKLIYKVYFEKPYTDLIGRVVGKETITGIYKITNLNNQKTYIGQAVNMAERWKQHIKRALGAEPITQNKLYPAMVEDGVWNFSFEIVEKCKKEDLSSREQYWQKFFGAKEYGYSIK